MDDVNPQSRILGGRNMIAYSKVGVASFALACAVGGAVALAADSQSQIPTSGEKVAGAPFEVR